jgi:hypothetical protein
VVFAEGLDERKIGRPPLAVVGPPGEDEPAIGMGTPGEFAEETGLADAGFPTDEGDGRDAAGLATQPCGQCGELVLAAD